MAAARSQAIDLAEHLEVICPDNGGMGDADLGDGELTIAAMAEDAARHPRRRSGLRPDGDAEAFRKLVDYSVTPREQASRLLSVLFPRRRSSRSLVPPSPKH